MHNIKNRAVRLEITITIYFRKETKEKTKS